MDPLHLCVATGPLALYLVVLGLLNLTRRPRAISGTVDRVILALAVSGLIAVGPMELFLPQAASDRYGPFVWFLLIGSYALCVILWLLIARPKLVIVNAPAELVRPAMEAVATRLDSTSRWAGDTLVLPQLGVQLHVEAYPGLRSMSLSALGERQSFTGWQRFHGELAAVLREVEVRPGPFGVVLLLSGLAGIALPLANALLHREAVTQRFWEMLRM